LASNHSITSLNLWGNKIGTAAQKATNKMLMRNRINAQNFLKASHAGNLQLLQTMLAANQVSPYCFMRSYANENYCYPEKSDSLHTALHLAVIEGHHDIARWLVKKIPQLLYMKDKNKKTPLALAKEKDDTTMTAIFSENEPQQTIKPEALVDDSKPKTIPHPPLPSTPKASNVVNNVKLDQHAGWLRCQNNKDEQGYPPESFLKKTTLQSSSILPTSRASSSASSLFSTSPTNDMRGSFMKKGAQTRFQKIKMSKLIRVIESRSTSTSHSGKST